jgi:hypothetical protein
VHLVAIFRSILLIPISSNRNRMHQKVQQLWSHQIEQFLVREIAVDISRHEPTNGIHAAETNRSDLFAALAAVGTSLHRPESTNAKGSVSHLNRHVTV